MTSRGAEPRPYATEVRRVTPESVALQEEAQVLRDRKLALEEAMRQERNRRLQRAAQKRSKASEVAHSGEAAAAAAQAPETAQQTHSQEPARAAAPQDLGEYRRELDSANGNKEVYRLHYYTSGHLDPADVHFYAAKGRVKAYQRHAPSPPRPQPASRRAHSHDDDRSHVLAIMAPLTETTGEQWTKSAQLRMEANQRVLRRIEERERREAALAAANRSGTRGGSAQRKASQVTAAPPRTISPQRGAQLPAAMLPPHDVRALAPPPPIARLPGRQENGWRTEGHEQSESMTRPQRWSPSRQRSPLRAHAGGSPLRVYGISSGVSQVRSEARRSPFKPSLTYSSASSSLRTSRFESLPVHPPYERRAVSPWRPLHDSLVSRSEEAVARPAYQPIAAQPPTGASSVSTPWESRRTWEGLSPHHSTFRLHGASRPLAFADNDPASHVGTSGKAEVDVSPLTPPPHVHTASRQTDSSGRGDEEPAAATTAGHPPPKTLLEGFRMPETVLKRDDLFQGTT